VDTQRNLELRAGRENNRTFDDVLQLADVGRSGVADQRVHGRRRDGFDPLAHPPGELLGEVADQRRDAVGPLPQGWQHDGEHVQSVVAPLGVFFENAGQCWCRFFPNQPIHPKQ
jgi:hypothetical protein